MGLSKLEEKITPKKDKTGFFVEKKSENFFKTNHHPLTIPLLHQKLY